VGGDNVRINSKTLHMRPTPLLVLCLLACSCQTAPESLPKSDQNTWSFEKDVESGTSATIKTGLSRGEVVAQLGHPESTRRFRDQPTIEVLTYTRTVPGPAQQAAGNTPPGSRAAVPPICCRDTIQVFLVSDIVSVVAVTRETENGLDHLPHRLATQPNYKPPTIHPF